MSKFIKIQSQQGGPYNRNQNLVDFKFGYGGETIDMSKSYVNIMSRCVVNGGNSDAVYNSKIQYLNDAGQVQDLSPPSFALVKDCSLSSQKAGNLEHIRRVDALRANLKPLTQTIEEYDSTLYKTTGQHKISDFISSPWIQLKGEGNVKSKNVSAPVQIQLSDLFELGNSVVSTKDLGEMRIHLELQAQRFSAVQTPKQDEVMGDAYYQQFEDVLQTEQSNITTLTTRQVFSGTLENSPYFVGMELQFTSTGAGGATNINESAIISELQLIKEPDNVACGKLILTLDKQLGDTLSASQSQTQISCVPTNCDSVSLLFDYAELVLRIVPEEKEKVKEIVYSTWTLEETNGNSLTNYYQQFLVEPNCYNLVAFPLPSTNDLVASTNAGEIVKWRWTIDNVDASNRDITLNSGLYLDRLNMTMLNDGKNLKSLVLSAPSGTEVSVSGIWTTNKCVGLLFQPVPMTQNRKVVNLKVESGSGVNKFMLYKQVAKTIKL
jgi:hypothetical protein